MNDLEQRRAHGLVRMLESEYDRRRLPRSYSSHTTEDSFQAQAHPAITILGHTLRIPFAAPTLEIRAETIHGRLHAAIHGRTAIDYAVAGKALETIADQEPLYAKKGLTAETAPDFVAIRGMTSSGYTEDIRPALPATTRLYWRRNA